MKIKDTFYILLAGLLPWGVMGCASQKMGDKVRVTPSDQVLMPDSTHAVQLDMTVEVPQKTLGKPEPSDYCSSVVGRRQFSELYVHRWC